MRSCVMGRSGAAVVAADGNRDALNDTFAEGRGAVYGCYAALEQLGFAFIHPLSPTLPDALAWAGAGAVSVAPSLTVQTRQT